MPRQKRKQYPKHAVRFEVTDVALETSARVSGAMHAWLDILCRLRETLRQERDDDRDIGRRVRAAGGTHRYLTKGDQYVRIAEMAKHDAALRQVHSQVRQDVADRIDRGTQRWLKQKGGPLRRVERKAFRSFNFTQYGFAVKVKHGRLHMSGIGEARLLGMRRLPGRPKSVRLVLKQGRWFAQFTCEVQIQHCPRAQRHRSDAVQALPDTGLDTGLKRIATLADGTHFLPNKPLKQRLPQLKLAQRAMARKFKARKKELAARDKAYYAAGLHGPMPRPPLSNRLKANIRRVAILHTKIANVRRDQLRKVARQIEQQYRLVAVEEHGIEFMRRNRRTSRSVSDVAPGLFKSILRNALGEDRYVPTSNRRPGIGGNSQTCVCDAAVPKTLDDRWHDCPVCGLSEDRDTVSANVAMKIAFGYYPLGNKNRIPAPRQGVVRRGEDQCGLAVSVTASGRVLTPVSAEKSSLKRPSSSRLASASNNAGAKATAPANNLPLLRAQAPLSGRGETDADRSRQHLLQPGSPRLKAAGGMS